VNKLITLLKASKGIAHQKCPKVKTFAELILADKN